MMSARSKVRHQRVADRVAMSMLADCLPGRDREEAEREAARQLGIPLRSLRLRVKRESLRFGVRS